MDEQFSAQLEEFKTDERELNDVLEQYDLDEFLEAEFDTLDAQFRDLQILYTSLLNTRKFLSNA